MKIKPETRSSRWLVQTYSGDGSVLESSEVRNGGSHSFMYSGGAVSWGIADLAGNVLITTPYSMITGSYLRVTIPASGPVWWS